MPVSDCEVRDPRIRRTRQSLQGALGRLLLEKNFDEISVQDITEAAAVNRATFYDHYTDKFALLDAMVAGGFHKLLSEREIQYDGSCPSAARAVVMATCDYLTQCESQRTRNQQQAAVEPLIDAAIVQTIRRVLMRGAKGAHLLPEAGSLSADILTTSASWAIYGAVKTWASAPQRPPAEEIVALVVKLAFPMLLEASGRNPPSSAVAPAAAHA